jgi:hypothetical protein
MRTKAEKAGLDKGMPNVVVPMRWIAAVELSGSPGS